ncbi:MAG: FecR domain-containing protein [Hydrogenophilaceae bacterium]
MRLMLPLAALLFWAGSALAGDAVGYVKTVKGEAYVVTAGKPAKAVVGTPVQAGSVLKTGSQAAMGVTFKDNTVMSFGPDTELTVDEYVYAPNQGNLKLGASLAKGTLAYLSGAIAKIKPDAVSVKTPTGTIGVRGTHFVVKVETD